MKVEAEVTTDGMGMEPGMGIEPGTPNTIDYPLELSINKTPASSATATTTLSNGGQTVNSSTTTTIDIQSKSTGTTGTPPQQIQEKVDDQVSATTGTDSGKKTTSAPIDIVRGNGQSDSTMKENIQSNDQSAAALTGTSVPLLSDGDDPVQIIPLDRSPKKDHRPGVVSSPNSLPDHFFTRHTPELRKKGFEERAL